MHVNRFLTPAVLIAALACQIPLRAQSTVTLTPAATPASGQPGITVITLTGSGFPAGTILPTAIDIKLEPAAGGTSTTTKAASITTVVGATRRVTFQIPVSITVTAPTAYLASFSGATTTNSLFSSANKATLTINPLARILSVTPNSGQVGQTVNVAILGQYTNFVQGATKANFGPGVGVNGAAESALANVTVTSPTAATASLKIGPNAAAGPRNVLIQTGIQSATLSAGFNVTEPPPPSISDFNPKTGPIGTLVTLTGSNLSLMPDVRIGRQGGGTMSAPVASASAASLTFSLPAGASTGPLSVTVTGKTATAASPLTVVASQSFSLSAAPVSPEVIAGQSVGILVSLSSANSFGQLAALALTGLPAGVTGEFKPVQITAGQTSVLTLTAPAGQPVSTSALAISASANVEGIALSQSASVSLKVIAPTTSFLGRTVVDNALQTALSGVTVTMLGKDGSGGTTGCTGSTVSDSAGNFLLKALPPSCAGRQLVGFDGLTATAPPGKYAGVNLVYTFTAGQVTASPVLVHLPRIDDKETFLVKQNFTEDQSYSWNTIPGLAVTVYKGTTFTMPDGTTPNPFPLVAVNVPIDRLPDAKPPVPTMLKPSSSPSSPRTRKRASPLPFTTRT